MKGKQNASKEDDKKIQQEIKKNSYDLSKYATKHKNKTEKKMKKDKNKQ